MTRFVPSRHTLRHLQRISAGDSLSTTTRAPTCLAARHHTNQITTQPLRQLSTSRRPCQPSASSTPTPSPSSQREEISSSSATVPDTTSYYTLFPNTLPNGPPPASPFPISLRDLKREFLRLQAIYHPDKYPTGSQRHRNAVALSSLINNAYRTLSDPLLRAQYLLLQNYDIDVTSEDNSQHMTDQGTLIEVMEAQESIEQAESQEDVDILSADNKDRIEETVETMGQAFAADDVETAKAQCVKLKYWRSLQQGLNDWEPGKDVRLVH